MTWEKTVFDTKEWLEAWSRATVEKVTAKDVEANMFAVEWSPFWAGYEADAELDRIWDQPLLTIGSTYSFYGPSYLLDEPGGVDATMELAKAHAEEWDTAGVLVANLPEEAALAWAELHPPDASVRLDVAYHRQVGEGADPVTGDAASSVRREWRRLWRRATEEGVRLVWEGEPTAAQIDEMLAFSDDTAERHGWPTVYDRTTCQEVLRIPGAWLIRADWQGQTVSSMIAFEHERRLYLWGGSQHPELLHELSPYLFVFYELLATGEERGLERIEFGRGNDQFKRKYGCDSTDTWSLWYARDEEQASHYRPRLEALHEGLSRAMEVPLRSLGEPELAEASCG